MASYTRFEDGDVLISSEKVSTPIWSGDVASLSTGSFNTGNQGSFSSDFYLDITTTPAVTTGGTGSQASTPVVQFSIAYADKLGSGSFAYEQNVESLKNYSPSRTIFGQYRSLVLGDEESDFYFKEGVMSENFWAISIDRARFKEVLMPESLKLVLGPAYPYSGSNTNIMLMSEAAIIPSNSTRYLDSGRVYSLYGTPAAKPSGSDEWAAIDDTAWSDGYGYLLPDIGVLLIDCKKVLDTATILHLVSGNATITTQSDLRYDASTVLPSEHNPWDNADILRRAIQFFELKAEETVTSNYVWVRAKNGQFNYSMNPSFITANGELRQSIMINSPETFITAVGLYNDGGDLLAVAKLSRPLLKSFNKEALIRIKLDY